MDEAFDLALFGVFLGDALGTFLGEALADGEDIDSASGASAASACFASVRGLRRGIVLDGSLEGFECRRLDGSHSSAPRAPLMGAPHRPPWAHPDHSKS